MKKSSLFFTALIALLLGFQSSLSAQKTATWKGGFPGQETNWACARNWSLNIVPDGNCHVVIPALLSQKKNYPVLSSTDEEVYSLVIESNAELSILPSGKLIILGLSPFDKPFWNAGTLILSGTLVFPNVGSDSIAKR